MSNEEECIHRHRNGRSALVVDKQLDNKHFEVSCEKCDYKAIVRKIPKNARILADSMK